MNRTKMEAKVEEATQRLFDNLDKKTNASRRKCRARLKRRMREWNEVGEDAREKRLAKQNRTPSLDGH